MLSKPPSPPPAYTVVAEAQAAPSRPQQPPPQPPLQFPQPQVPYGQGYYPYPQPQVPYSPYLPQPPPHHHHHHHHAAYGPTPIVQQEALLVPYFDPRSAFALSEAATRAKWRFLLAMTYALLILFVLGIATGAEMRVEER